MSKVKGSKISSKLAFVRDLYGEETLQNLMKSLDQEDQKLLRAVLDTGWYPAELYERVIRAICKTVGAGQDEIYSAIGRHSAELVLDRQYKAFRAKSPENILRNMVPMHAMMNDPGEMEIVTESSNRCTIIIKQPKSTTTVCKVAGAFYKRMVELCGGDGVKIDHPKCSGRYDRFCQFEITWVQRAA